MTSLSLRNRYLLIYHVDGETRQRYVRAENTRQASLDFTRLGRPPGDVVFVRRVLKLPAFSTGRHVITPAGDRGVVSCEEVNGDITVQFGAEMRRFSPWEQLGGAIVDERAPRIPAT